MQLGAITAFYICLSQSISLLPLSAILRIKEDEQVDMGKTSLLKLNGVDISYYSAKEAIINELEECFLLLLKDP